MATVNEDAGGVYTCTPYNSYGTMGPSAPTNVILQVSEYSKAPGSLPALYSKYHILVSHTTLARGIRCTKLCTHTSVCILMGLNCICHNELKTYQKRHFFDLFTSTCEPSGINRSQLRLTTMAALLGS